LPGLLCPYNPSFADDQVDVEVEVVTLNSKPGHPEPGAVPCRCRDVTTGMDRSVMTRT
jgi:hypothetical protein